MGIHFRLTYLFNQTRSVVFEGVGEGEGRIQKIFTNKKIKEGVNAIEVLLFNFTIHFFIHSSIFLKRP